MKKLFIPLCLLALAFTFYACEEAETPGQNPAFTVASVKAHYESLSNQQAGRLDDPIEILWNHPEFQNLVRGEVITFPVSYHSNKTYRVGDQPEEYDASTHSYAFSYQDNDHIVLELVEFIATEPGENFTGIILVKDWFGDLKHVLQVADGVMIGSAEIVDGSQGRIQCWEITNRYCTVRENGPDDCDEEIQILCLDFINTMHDSWEDYGNSGGGSNPDVGGGSGTGQPVSCGEEYVLVDNKCVKRKEVWEEEVCTTSAFDSNNCLSSVWSKLKSTNAVTGILDKFENSSWLDLCIDANLNSSANAQTSVNGSNVTIDFNTSKLARSQLSIARTFLHEMVHAELFRKVKSVGGQVSQNDFPGIYDYYRRFYKNWQHQQMAAHYIDAIASGLSLFDNQSRDFSFYQDIAWNGLWKVPDHNTIDPNDLIETEAWQNLSQTEQDRIKNVIANYKASENNNCQ